MKRVGPAAGKGRAVRVWVTLAVVLAAMALAIAFVIQWFLASLHAIAHPGSGAPRLNLLLLAVCAFVIGVGVAIFRRLVRIGAAGLLRGRLR